MARKINPHTHTDWRRWYASYEWRRRARRQMANEPLCAMCLAEGRVVPAEVADHVERVDGDYTRFRPIEKRGQGAGCKNGIPGERERRCARKNT